MKQQGFSLYAQLSDIFSRPECSFITEFLAEYPRADVYLVGGSVRDLLLGRQSKDFDLVVRSISIARLERFLKKYGKVHAVGRRFGVLKVTPAKQSDSKNPQTIDIALPRLEFSVHLSGHIRDFSVQSDQNLPIEDDLSRRDFTINAMAYDIRRAELVDPWNGLKDLEKRVIRAVGDPHTRFAEDYSRMLRALRFSCQLGFRLDAHTARAISERMPHINDEIIATTVSKKKKKTEMIRVVPFEVAAKELLKSFNADPVRAFDLYDRFGVFAVLAPELLTMKKCRQPKTWHAEGDVWKHTRFALAAFKDKRYLREFGKEHPELLLVIATLFHDIGKPYAIKTPRKDKVDRIRFDGHDRVGADITRAIAERLRLNSVEGLNVSPQVLHWLIKNHLLLLNSVVPQMKNTTIEKYFFKDLALGKALQRLFVVDALASHRQDGKTTLTAYRTFKRRLDMFLKTSKPNARRTLPPAILNGHEIMTAAKITPGPLVGTLCELLREEQLAGRVSTKKQAQEYIKKIAKMQVKSQGR